MDVQTATCAMNGTNLRFREWNLLLLVILLAQQLGLRWQGLPRAASGRRPCEIGSGESSLVAAEDEEGEEGATWGVYGAGDCGSSEAIGLEN